MLVTSIEIGKNLNQKVINDQSNLSNKVFPVTYLRNEALEKENKCIVFFNISFLNRVERSFCVFSTFFGL